MSTTEAESKKTKRLRILLLHGYTQSGPLFHAKTRALEKSLRKAFPAPMYAMSLEYPTGPLLIKPADEANSAAAASVGEDAYGWWRRKERDGGETKLGQSEGQGFVYKGMDEGLARVAEYLVRTTNEGEQGFDGVIGFSQGACFAGMLASLLERGRRKSMDVAKAQGGMGFPAALLKPTGEEGDEGVVHSPLKFAVSYSGFAPPPNPLYDAIYDPKISTPLLHFLGTVDTVVEEARSMRLVDACTVDRESEVGKKRVVYHPGGHFLPSGKMPMASLVTFIQEAMGWQSEDLGPRGKEELDLPF